MAKLKISDYSSTSAGANLNTDINSIDIDEGCAPSGINNAIRTLMAQLKDFQTGVSGDSLTLGGALSGTSATFSGNVTASAISGASLTLSGALSGTSATFSGNITASAISGVSMTLSGDLTVDTNTLYVDSTNNKVGIGTSSPADPLEISHATTSRIRLSETTNSLILNVGQWGSKNRIESSGGSDLIISNYDASNPIAFYTGFGGQNTERMRITSGGNVGIGTSSVTQKLDVNGGLQIYSTNKLYFFSTGYSIHAQDGLEFETADYMKFQTGGANERMRIDSSGFLLHACTTQDSNNSSGVRLHPDGAIFATRTSEYSGIFRRSSTDGGVILFRRDASNVGSISVTTSATAYNTSSDYRLKENVAPMSGSIDRLKQLKPSTWSWKTDGSHGEGFLAHEAQTVVPEAVHGTKDAVDDEGNPVYQGIDQSKLVPLLTAALQEAITKIEDLETRIQALENQ